MMVMKEKGCSLKVLGLLAMLAAMVISAIPVRAEEAVAGTLQQLVEVADIKESPDENANTLASLEEGTNVVVYGEAQDSWCKIEYKGIEGYIESGALGLYQMENVEELEQEFQEVEEKTSRTIDEYELMEKERRTSGIWKIVIVILVVVIFGAGIFSARKKNQEGQNEKEE